MSHRVEDHGGTDTPASVPARALRRLIRGYQAWSATRPPHCRFTPPCSQYAYDAITAYGAARGVWMAGRRLLRCRPGGGRGYDPVPLQFERDPDSGAPMEVRGVL